MACTVRTKKKFLEIKFYPMGHDKGRGEAGKSPCPYLDLISIYIFIFTFNLEKNNKLILLK